MSIYLASYKDHETLQYVPLCAPTLQHNRTLVEMKLEKVSLSVGTSPTKMDGNSIKCVPWFALTNWVCFACSKQAVANVNTIQVVLYPITASAYLCVQTQARLTLLGVRQRRGQTGKLLQTKHLAVANVQCNRPVRSRHLSLALFPLPREQNVEKPDQCRGAQQMIGSNNEPWTTSLFISNCCVTQWSKLSLVLCLKIF